MTTTTTVGWIWPKDPRPGKPHRWSRLWRLSDVVMGKGPNIYVGSIRNAPRPTRHPRAPRPSTEADEFLERLDIHHTAHRPPLPPSPPRAPRPRIEADEYFERQGIQMTPATHEWNPRLKAKTNWSLWGREHREECPRRHCDDCDRIQEEEAKADLLGVRRRANERYDFQQRKYRVLDKVTWSGAMYCNVKEHVVPVVYQNRDGREHAAEYWQRTVHSHSC
ncbi:hypothetical protein BJX99DRAFT_259534 [Aspergillus californicus]